MWNWNCCVLVVFWVQGLVVRRLGGGAVWSRDEEEGTTRPPPTLEMDGNRAAVHGTWCHVSGLFEDATTDIEACSSSSASSLTRVLLPAKKLQAARRKLIKEWWQRRQACILVHCSALHPTGHPVGAFLPGRSLSPLQPTHLLLVGVLLIRVFFLGFCDGWQQQDGCHTKTNSRFCKRLHYVGAMQITIDYWLWAHLWKWKNSTCECQSTGIAKAQVQCIHTCTTWIRLHHREHTMPFFSQSPAEELCSGMHYFSCVRFSSSVASILLAIVRKYAPQKAHLPLLSLGFGRGGWCWAH